MTNKREGGNNEKLKEDINDIFRDMKQDFTNKIQDNKNRRMKNSILKLEIWWHKRKYVWHQPEGPITKFWHSRDDQQNGGSVKINLTSMQKTNFRSIMEK